MTQQPDTYTDRAGRERDTKTHALVVRAFEPTLAEVENAQDADCNCSYSAPPGASKSLTLFQVCPGHKALALLADLKSQIGATL